MNNYRSFDEVVEELFNKEPELVPIFLQITIEEYKEDQEAAQTVPSINFTTTK